MATSALDNVNTEALSQSVHNRIVPLGWTQDDDTSLAEYIVLMLANGKTQSQVAAELSGELLQDVEGTDEFAAWLFQQINPSSGEQTSAPETAPQPAEAGAPAASQPAQESVAEVSIPAAYEADMTEAPPDNAYGALRDSYNPVANKYYSPKGPRGSNSSTRGGRGAGRGSNNRGSDAALHRVRGNDRIGSHNVRGAPKGPRGLQNRPGMQKALNGVLGGSPQGSPRNMAQNGMPDPQQMMNFSPEQQMQYLAMMEQQARLMAQWNELQNGMNGNPQSRSMFDRVESPRGRGGMRGRGRGNFQQNGSRNGSIAPSEPKPEGEAPADGATDATMEGVDQAPAKTNDPATTMCHWNLQCTNKECKFAHQSPVAPMNIPVDVSQACTFGVACKNTTCNLRHPSPALKKDHQAQSECKFYPNCTKFNCPFKHPEQPVCSYGASCKNANCKFTHLQTLCKFNPCTNTKCPFRHAAGQNRTMADYSWTPELAKQREEAKAAELEKQHVSDRKFVSEEAGEEELIKPDSGMAVEETAQPAAVEETIT
ncbi:uncharacterized protein AB675_11466 [Cyphellophora attinorum]|uniref:Nab2-like CCCH zinc finger domain-containing protein n=1 Tax=Cyphellophora attinorum TaxID=1664694 RepID=A0A0N1H984_9EURO|nr:uncharacterized protein AB675_11466 [Phialophora attinorum]KPI40034.1 hypothetical protein AB675_11466 [Phialophora attinorum]